MLTHEHEGVVFNSNVSEDLIGGEKKYRAVKSITPFTGFFYG